MCMRMGVCMCYGMCVCTCMCVCAPFEGTWVHACGCAYIYTNIIGELSSTFEVCLAARAQFDSDHGVDFPPPTCCQSATFVRPLFAFYCPLFFRGKK